MKLKKIVLLSLIATSLTLSSCGMIPETDEKTEQDGSTTTTKTYKKGGKSYTEETTKSPDGTVKESVYVEDKDGNYTEESTTTSPDGTVKDEKIVYDEDTKTETTDSTTTKADGTEIVYHEEAKREGGEGQNVKESFTATETTTFPAEDTSGKTKEVTESTGSLELNTEGNLVEKKSTGKTTTDYKDGSKEETTFTKEEDFSDTKDASIRMTSTSTKTNTDGSKEEATESYTEFNPNGVPSTEKSAHSAFYKDKTTTYTDKDGKITSKVQVQTDTQDVDFKAEPERQITTTTTYADGKATGVTVETYFPPKGKINDGLYMLEKKSADGKTTLSTEAEYVFYNDNGKSGNGKLTVIILKDDGTSKKAKVTYDAHSKYSLYHQYSWYEEEAKLSEEFVFTHKCFINTLLQHMTQFKKSADGKTLSIIREGDGEYSADDVPAVTGKDYDYILYDENDHTEWDSLKLSFDSKF